MTNARNTRTTILLTKDERDEIDQWSDRQSQRLSRSEAVRLMVSMVSSRELKPSDDEMKRSLRKYATKG